MGVELRGGETLVAQQLLNDPQIRSSLEQMGGVRVAKGVRMDVSQSQSPNGQPADVARS